MTRLRSMADIDLSTANSQCPKCRGTGVCGQREVEIGGDLQMVPIICSCVCEAGGVKADALDIHYRKVDDQVKKGIFVPRTVETIMAMDEKTRMMAIEAYERLLARPSLERQAKLVISEILEEVYKQLKEQGGSEAVH